MTNSDHRSGRDGGEDAPKSSPPILCEVMIIGRFFGKLSSVVVKLFTSVLISLIIGAVLGTFLWLIFQVVGAQICTRFIQGNCQEDWVFVPWISLVQTCVIMVFTIDLIASISKQRQ